MQKIIRIIAVIVICATLLVVGCIPKKIQWKDGGTVSYHAILYRYVEYDIMGFPGEDITGTEFIIFPFNWVFPEPLLF